MCRVFSTAAPPHQVPTQFFEPLPSKTGPAWMGLETFAGRMAQAKARIWPRLSYFAPNLLDIGTSKACLSVPRMALPGPCTAPIPTTLDELFGGGVTFTLFTNILRPESKGIFGGFSSAYHARLFEPQSKVNFLKSLSIFGDKYPQNTHTWLQDRIWDVVQAPT